jgi:hypothetical protein
VTGSPAGWSFFVADTHRPEHPIGNRIKVEVV